MRAVELLAELLGRKKAEIALITELPKVVMQFPGMDGSAQGGSGDDPGDDSSDGVE